MELRWKQRRRGGCYMALSTHVIRQQSIRAWFDLETADPEVLTHLAYLQQIIVLPIQYGVNIVFKYTDLTKKEQQER